LRDSRGTQRLEVDDRAGRLSANRLDRPPVVVGLIRAPGEKEHGREIADPVGEVKEEAKRSGIGPVDVVDHEQQRPTFGEV
jgi:hypothetical protein